MRDWKSGMMQWLKKKIVDPLLQIIRRGAEPKQLAFSTALGMTLGVFPICGITIFLCGMAIALLRNRCHAPSVMLANFIATPIELSLVIPFLRLGEAISGGPRFPLTSDALKKVVTGQASREVLLSVFHALLGWIITAPFILGTLYIIFVPCFKYLVRKFSSLPPSPKKQVHPHAEIKLKIHPLEMCFLSSGQHHRAGFNNLNLFIIRRYFGLMWAHDGLGYSSPMESKSCGVYRVRLIAWTKDRGTSWWTDLIS